MIDSNPHIDLQPRGKKSSVLIKNQAGLCFLSHMMKLTRTGDTTALPTPAGRSILISSVIKSFTGNIPDVVSSKFTQ